MNDMEHSSYRLGVGILLLNKQNKIFVAKRIDTLTDAWQMPQGGIDEEESSLEAALRELKEEIGTDYVSLLHELPNSYFYDLPQDLAKQLWGGKYKGQKQKWFIFRFEGKDHDICLETEHPEFNAWRWAEPQELPSLAIEFKRDLYTSLFNVLIALRLV